MFKHGRIDSELKAEFLEEFVPPLFNQTAGSDDQNPTSVGSHDQFADVKTRHDGLTGTGIVSQNEAQRLSWQHGFVDGSDLVWERFYVGSVDRHHWIEQKRQVNAFGFACQLKCCTVAIKGPRTFNCGDADVRFIGAPE